MTDERDTETYEPPAIEERSTIDQPLVAIVSGETPTAAFHPADGEVDPVAYEPPAIEERTAIDMPLIGNGSPVLVTAAFHPATD